MVLCFVFCRIDWKGMEVGGVDSGVVEWNIISVHCSVMECSRVQPHCGF